MKDVFKCICNAQIASDGGKGIDILRFYAPTVWQKGYKAKDREILRAISLINKGNGYSVKYSVSRDYYSTRLDRRCYIVYFTYKVNGERKQISFHTFMDLSDYTASSTHIVRWDKGNSRQNVIELLNERR